MTNSADPDQLASEDRAQFAKTGHIVFSKRRVKKLRLQATFTFIPVIQSQLDGSHPAKCAFKHVQNAQI